ncbi:hypothetical protein GPECTOR_35g879 [Gonium pectorale]|uniref:Uncharacterized protein n=1 Tax=Gonium pectorale TaxID=33097 RepID=A0A150GC58_GONPE|nr:hypothetical protein GPECTOR_35g879 [Gonium pectorale]|eukprot:KXZ47441.1 hypothetical protein GPECTOR_35g879 [Gonium pectorale]
MDLLGLDEPDPLHRVETQQRPTDLEPQQPDAGWACELTGSQREALRAALVAAVSAVLNEVGGMWCDALVAMLALEWPAAHDAMSRPSLRTGAETLMAGPHLYPRQQARTLTGYTRNDQGLSGSAVAALHSYNASGSAIPCIVPDQEKRVYFAAAGPALRRVEHYLHDPQALASDPAAQAIVVHSSPAAVLADPAPTRLNAGIVLSFSPLLGSDPSVDKSVAKWLRVHVRPSVRGLLRLLRSAAAGRKGGLLGALRHLVDGHWVLAFPDAERSSNARQLVEQAAHRLRALYCELLSPLLGSVMD